MEYYSAENYFQCAKTTTKEEHEKVRKSGHGEVKKNKKKTKLFFIGCLGGRFICKIKR